MSDLVTTAVVAPVIRWFKMRYLRIVLCQLRTHPAIYGGHIAYPEEPFLPDLVSGPSLSRLGAKGIDVHALQDLCRDRYAAWIDTRLKAVIDFLSHLRPIPDIVLFPEGAVPLDSLSAFRAWSAASGPTILAGTHTPLNTLSALASYSALGITPKERKKVSRMAAGSVLPLIRNGKVLLVPKRVASVFERTDVSIPDPEDLSSMAYPIQTTAGKVDLLPLVCIEALRLPKVKNSYHSVGVVSYDAHPSQFQPFIDQEVRNRKPVFYCNDGRFGGTRIGAVRDERAPNWIHDTMPNGLPPGDAILVLDIDVDVTTVEVGTAAPRPAYRLVSLTSVVGEHAPSAEVSRALADAGALPEGAARADQLTRVLQTGTANPLQNLRMAQLADLERRGLQSADWWAAIGRDCTVAGQNDLEGLEASLAAACRDSLLTLLPSKPSDRPDVASLFLEYYQDCQRRAGNVPTSNPVPLTAEPASVVDREAEVRSVAEFLDDQSTVVLEVSGLPQIGKSSVLDKALKQSGVQSLFRIPITSTSSADYLLYSILKRGPGLPLPPYRDIPQLAQSGSFSAAIRSQRVIVFERAHLLVDGGTWRDDTIGTAIKEIINAAEEVRVKIIFETQRELPIEFANPGARQRLHVGGLQKHLRHFGEALFDAQLRKAGLSPDILPPESKGFIVERLGGHPVAIALAADASYEEGGDAVLKALKDRKGFYLSFLERLLRPLNLTDDDQTVLRLLTLARIPVERGVISSTVSFPAGPVIRNLVVLGAVETVRDGRIDIAGVVREYFDPAELTPPLIEAFHQAAAESFEAAAKRNPGDLARAIEAEYHAGVVGKSISISSQLLDGALATAQEHFRGQRYKEASSIVDVLLRKQRSLDILRLAAQISARLNDVEKALAFAREVLQRDPRDTRLLSDLAKIFLTQYQDDRTAARLVQLARSAGVENISILVVEGRMCLRQQQLYEAERVFLRARQLSRTNSWPYYYLGVTYQRMGRLEDAINALEDGQEFFYRSEARNRKALNAIRTQLGLAYLFNDDVDSASRILDLVVEDDPTSPEVARAYAALTIRRDGIQMAEKAFARLSEAKIRNRFDRCQFHLFYGMFHLGIGNAYEASKEFAKAHAADKSNVYVMMKWARTLYELAKERYLEGDEVYKAYVGDCARIVEKILVFDPDNVEGVALLTDLHTLFGIEIRETPDGEVADEEGTK